MQKYKIALNLGILRKRLELLEGRDIPIAEIARHLDLGEAAVYKLFRNDYSGVQFDTLAQMLTYFKSRGLEVTVGDFFLVEEVENSEGKSEARYIGEPVAA